MEILLLVIIGLLVLALIGAKFVFSIIGSIINTLFVLIMRLFGVKIKR